MIKRLHYRQDEYLRRSWTAPRRRSRFAYIFVIACLCMLYFRSISAPNTSEFFLPSLNIATCPHSPIANDILLVMRTGATEVLQKLPIHLNTTLRCVPHYVFYSDYEENIEGQKIHDVFDEISEELTKSVPDFEIYHQLKNKGREGLVVTGTHSGSGAQGALENPSWRLDKFKFLPMVDRAFHQRPGANWFVFIEADTYLVWANLLEYLSKFDPKTPKYIGKQMFIGDVLFAHGGSGFVLSRAAAEKVSQHWRANMNEYNNYTIREWAGDMVLGKVLKDVDVPLLWAFPHFQGDPMALLDYNVTKIDRRPWCYPAITYHHMPPNEIRVLWEFEQHWQKNNDAPMRHADVFKKLIVPSLSQRKVDWDNYSVNSEYSVNAFAGLTDGEIKALPRSEREAHGNFARCMATCESRANCLQYSYSPGRCSISTEVRLGRKSKDQCLEYSSAASKCSRYQTAHTGSKTAEGVASGWLVNRIKTYVQDMEHLCTDDSFQKWVT